MIKDERKLCPWQDMQLCILRIRRAAHAQTSSRKRETEFVLCRIENMLMTAYDNNSKIN